MSIRAAIERHLRIEGHAKPQVYMRLVESADFARLSYWLELSFSAGIATFGLVLNSPAVVIGAMLISPLMGPIMGAGLALAAADLYLGMRSFLNLIASLVAAVAISASLVWFLPLHTPTAEILARTKPNLLDLGVALMSGFAGSLLVFRKNGDGSAALPGVAIAVALMPPLCTSGFGFGIGPNWSIIAGAGLLFLTNLAAIIASAFLVFLVVRMDARDVREKIDHLLIERASHDHLYQLVSRTTLARAFGDIGKLRWRILMLLIVLGVLFLPLKKGLVQVRNETVARAAVSDAVRRLVSQDDIVGQQTSLGNGADPIRESLMVTVDIPDAKLREAERSILRRTGREAHLSVRQVADQAEIARLREGLETPAAPPPPQNLEAVRADVVGRLDSALKEIWPQALPLQRSEIGFAADATSVRLEFEGPDPLPPTAVEILTLSLQTRLAIPGLRVIVENKPAPRKVVDRGARKRK